MRSLEKTETLGHVRHLVGALALLVGWSAWMRYARVCVYATTGRARLEVSRMVHRVAAQEQGRIAGLRLELGHAVGAGDVLLELDSVVEERRLDEALTHAEALSHKAVALRAEVAAQEEVRAWQLRVDARTIARAELDLQQAAHTAEHHSSLARIEERLQDEQLASLIDRLNAESQEVDGKLKRSAAEVDIERLTATQGYDERRARATIVELTRQLADLEAQSNEADAAIATARAQLERRVVRAPAAGTLGTVAPLQLGDVVKVGDALAVVIPSEDVHVVAEFDPADAVGRISRGQPARVRLNGFAWTQFGTLDARVTEVASEPRDRTIRVELGVDPSRMHAMPIRHGMPGTVEIEVEQVAPWELLLRRASLVVHVNGPVVAATEASPDP
jgi:multidrug resistance efflux pump